VESLTDTLLSVHDTLGALGVKHALCGGLAANLYRKEMRATTDVDFYVVIVPTELVAVSQAFEREGWTAHPYWRQGQLLRLDREGFPRVDCLIAATDYEKSTVENAVEHEIAGRSVPVVTPEDLAVYKLAAGRLRDWETVAAMINSVDDLDEQYIVEMLDEIGMADRWDRAKAEAVLEAQDRG
jgi:hypothetical protein